MNSDFDRILTSNEIFNLFNYIILEEISQQPYINSTHVKSGKNKNAEKNSPHI